MEQWRQYAQFYRDHADANIAERFIVAVEDALRFIGESPYACSTYNPGEGFDELRKHQFRKWNLHKFPHVVLFRLDDAAIFVELLYAHKMDIPSRLIADIAPLTHR